MKLSPLIFFVFLAHFSFAQSLIDTQWQVLEIQQINSRKMLNVEKNNLFVAFGKNKNIGFNFDVNGCSSTYEINEDKKTLAISNEITCTQACCDKISIPYQQFISYKRKKQKLTLYTKDKQKIVCVLSPPQKIENKERQD